MKEVMCMINLFYKRRIFQIFYYIDCKFLFSHCISTDNLFSYAEVRIHSSQNRPLTWPLNWKKNYFLRLHFEWPTRQKRRKREQLLHCCYCCSLDLCRRHHINYILHKLYITHFNKSDINYKERHSDKNLTGHWFKKFSVEYWHRFLSSSNIERRM